MDTLTDTITLKKETVAGFVDRGGNFRTDGPPTFLADRWVSDFFNIRPNGQSTQEAEEKKGG
jgi:hypothetical protein